MATLVSAPVRAIADGVVDDCGLASAVLSGIVPDRRHLDNGGFHCSVEDLRKHGNQDDYSNSRIDDRDFNVRYGAAVDVTLSAADMKRAYKRVYAVWKDKSDPRGKYLNAVNGWDGSGDAVRLDFVTRTAKYASPDHRWHNHIEIRRRYLLDAKAARAVVSVYAGESKASWLAREEPPGPVAAGKAPAVKPVPKPKPKPKPAVAHPPGSRVLRYAPGKALMRGDDVAYVQRYLGVSKAGKADGVFGARTRAGVRWYQAMRRLGVDGIVGAKTFRSMGIQNNL